MSDTNIDKFSLDDIEDPFQALLDMENENEKNNLNLSEQKKVDLII